MKKLCLTLGLLCLFNGQFSLANENSLPEINLSKTYTGGLNPEGDLYSQCNINWSYDIGGTLTKIDKVNGLESRQVAAIQLKDPKIIYDTILRAKEGPFERRPGDLDVPTTSLSASLKSKQSTQYIDLYAQGQIVTRNHSRAAASLIRFIEQLCK